MVPLKMTYRIRGLSVLAGASSFVLAFLVDSEWGHGMISRHLTVDGSISDHGVAKTVLARLIFCWAGTILLLTAASPRRTWEDVGRIISVATCLLTAVFFIVFLATEPNYLNFFCNEDRFFENATAVFYFVSFLLGIYVVRSLGPEMPIYRTTRLWFLLLSLFFLFVGMEEISWGQRLFGYGKVPLSVNYQGETNIHNLVALGSTFQIQQLLVLVFGFLVPATHRGSRWANGFIGRMGFPVARVWAMLPFATGLIFGALHDYYQDTREIAEFYFSIAYMTFGVMEWFRRVKRLPDGRKDRRLSQSSRRLVHFVEKGVAMSKKALQRFPLL